MNFKFLYIFISNLIHIGVLLANKCDYGYQGKTCEECGKQFVSPNLKIVGGVEAVPSSWPSMALVEVTYKFYADISPGFNLTQKTFFCGGTLIDKKTVLTAAHCFLKEIVLDLDQANSYIIPIEPNQFFPTYESMYKVYLGVHNIRKVLETHNCTLPCVSSSIEKFITHQGYGELSKANDIAVIKLSNEVEFSKNIQPACLPSPELQLNNKNTSVWAAGWGKLKSDGYVSANLQNVKMQLYSSSYCRYVASEVKKLWNKQLCAGYYPGGKDTCQGDSGGPLFLKDNVNGKEKFVLVGVTSYGDGCGEPERPGIYTKVSSYLDWIYSNIE